MAAGNQFPIIYKSEARKPKSETNSKFECSNFLNRDSVGPPTVAAGIKSTRPARIALRSRMAGVVADATSI